jgi:catechol 2,3-dioxygenase-like lactoylglutathione lyase family enzyme
MTPEGDAPPFAGVLETSLYHDAAETDAIERFYGEVLGLTAVSRWPGAVAFRVGAGVLLLFERGALAKRDSPIAAHGSHGPGHACLVMDGRKSYDAWRSRLLREGVEITHEHDWDGGYRSLYFTDPAGNLLEIADGDLWPRL